MNREKPKRSLQPNPVANASLLSKLTFWWLKPMFLTGLSRTIEEEDIYDVKNNMRSDENTGKFAKCWQLELRKKKPSILRVIFKVYGFNFIILMVLFLLAETFARVIQPICLGGFVTYFSKTNNNDVTLNDAFWYASGMILCTILLMTVHPFNLYRAETGCKIRVACSGLIYKKTLRMLKSSSKDGQNGQIINLLSSDLSKLNMVLTSVSDVLNGPIQTIVFFIVIYMEIGIAAAVGMAFLASFIPLQGHIGKKTGQLRMKNTKQTDVRVKIMNEILMGIQVIKMYAWEKLFAKLVDEIRKKEVSAFRSISYLQATIDSMKMVPKVSIFLSLLSYVYFGNIITARKVFIVSSYFNTLAHSMCYFWPNALMRCAEANTSIKRIQEFLLAPESKYSSKINKKAKLNDGFVVEGNNLKDLDGNVTFHKVQHKNLNEIDEEKSMVIPEMDGVFRRVQNTDASEKFIRLEKVKAVWEASESEQINGIYDLSIDIKTDLCAIVGQVGSGKSTLLNVILGELDLDAGAVTINGSISYASQEPWIFEGSVRSNIVFVEDYDEQRYKKVVEVCALERDFRLLPQGDKTIVGERGSSLSGGQRARVNLARAIYKQSDIYLLDDPLSAVDTHVGKHIFKKCVKEFLADKICVLVTHQLQYLKDEQHVVLLNNGRVEAEGPFKTLEKFNKETLIHAQDGPKDEEEEIEHNAGDTARNQQYRKHSSASSTHEKESKKDSNSRKELQATGSVKFRTYKIFFQAAQSTFSVIALLILFVVAQCFYSGSDYFLSKWINWEENKMKSNLSEYHLISSNLTNMFISVDVDSYRNTLLITYTCIIVLGSVCYIICTFSFFRMCLRISINLHGMIFRGVSRAKMTFFNNNPSGRILNRFAGDINFVDSLLPNTMADVLDCFLQYAAVMTINAIVNPWLLIPAIVSVVAFYFIRLVFIKTGRSFKRIEALSRSPVFSHVNATLQGSVTIRAFNAGNILESEFHEFQDRNTSSTYLFVCTVRWLAFWLDFVCLLFIAFVTYSFLIFEDSFQSGTVGLAVLSSINLIGICQWGVRQTAELENQMTSVERIIEYAELPSEPALESDEKYAPQLDWPSQGNIEFKALSLRYSEHSDRVLHDITFSIDANEKIGVVGRTGAGKSSIIQSLFRLAHNEGQILIDRVDIGEIGLHDLRKKISIIPQEAVLFSGSLRFNLDPFGERSDDKLWDSLEQVELKSVVSAMPNGIDSKVLDGGSNFSAGQRQLVCLARAILRNNKILILDEATANVDSETDKLIQETIRSRFADCTVITIAHRLNTVMDSDKVLVVDAGKVVEFDHPFKLIKENGTFKRLLEQTGSETASALTLIAKESYEKSKINETNIDEKILG